MTVIVPNTGATTFADCDFTEEEYNRRITKARTRIITTQPFFGTLIMKLKCKYNFRFPTMGTNGVDIYINPEFAMNMPLTELAGVFCHEVMHVALKHPQRFQDSMDKDTANQAMDYAINGILEDSGITLPESRLYDTAYRNDDGRWKSWEEIYRLIFVDSPPDDGEGEGEGEGKGEGIGQGDGQDPCGDTGGCGGVMPAPVDQDGIAETAIDDVDVHQAETAARMAGKGSDALARAIGKELRPKVDWVSIMREFMIRARDDYSWKRPNRRFSDSDIIFPSVDGEEMGEVWQATDLSGSITDEEKDQFFGEGKFIAQELRPKKFHAVYFADGVTGHDTFEQGEEVVFNPRGCGGTDVRPVFDLVDETSNDIECMVIMTDGYTPFPEQAPDYPVLWVCTTDVVAPFGLTININQRSATVHSQEWADW